MRFITTECLALNVKNEITVKFELKRKAFWNTCKTEYRRVSQLLSEVIMYKWSDLLWPIGGTSVRLTAYSSNRSRRLMASYDPRHFSRTVWHNSSGRALLFVTSFKSSVVPVLEITHSLSGFPDHAAYKQIVKNPGQIKSQNYSKAKKNNHYYYYYRGTLTSTCSSRPKNNNCKK